MNVRALLHCLLIAFALLGSPRARAQAPEAAAPLPAGVELRELERDGQPIWLYLPKQGAASALVVVPPDGGTLLTAPELGESDREQHLPYVEAGFAVVSFRPSGAISGESARKDIEKAMAEFVRARGGVVDAQRAIAVALESAPTLAGKPIFAAGHSSAGNLVLALGAEDTRIRALVAYAPVADAETFLSGGFLEKIATNVPGALDLATDLSPLHLVAKLDTPLMLFHAEDDDVAPIADTRVLARALKARNRPPHLVIVASGGHFDSMLREGLPAGVAWLKERLTAKPAEPQAQRKMR